MPTLDGWRAIAIFAVILFHDSLYSAGPFNLRWLQVHGLAGVDIFFGISGILICSRLLEEERVHGTINLKQFYIRRFFRIVPPAFCYLIVVGWLGLLGRIPVLPKEWFAALFFYRNYSRFSQTPGHIDWYTAHYWSLAVEEHFYLILPSVLVFAPKRWRVPVLAGMVSLVCCWRLYRQQTRPWIFLLQHTDTRLDALLLPAICAILLAEPKSRTFLGRIVRFWPVLAAMVLYLITSGRFPRATPFAESLLIPLVLLGTMLEPGGWFGRFLELRPLRWIGKISYSLYLWQGLFFTGHFYPWLQPFGRLQSFPMRWIMLLGCANASFYFLERPMMKLGHRLAPPVTPGRFESS